jgi:two-component system sensor histidine kinase YesM
MLRYSLSNKERLVPIAQEVHHIQDFLQIQKFRFEDRLSFQINKELDSHSYYTPKFILQPIIENSIKYGLEKRKNLKIEIIVKRQENHDILFVLRDNGPGISEDELAKIMAKLQSDPMTERSSGFGLLNVHARVMMMFGKQYELKVKSTEDNGTEVIIRIPAISKKEVDLYSKREEVENGDD